MKREEGASEAYELPKWGERLLVAIVVVGVVLRVAWLGRKSLSQDEGATFGVVRPTTNALAMNGAHDARSYAFVVLFSIWSTHAFVRALDDPKRTRSWRRREDISRGRDPFAELAVHRCDRVDRAPP